MKSESRIGPALMSRRIELGISLERAARDTNIRARMLEALLQQRVRIRQATPLGALLPKSAPLPALSANGRPMSTTAGLGVFVSGGAFVGAFAGIGTRDHIIGSGGVGRGFPSGSGGVGRGFPSGSSILVGIAAFVFAMALVGAMPVFGKLVL